MEPTRYFKQEDTIWKFTPGQNPQLRTSLCRVWGESDFASLEAFLADPAVATEITALEAEEGNMTYHGEGLSHLARS